MQFCISTIFVLKMWSGTVKKRNNPNPNCKTGGMLAQTPLTEALKAQFKIL